jgi:hypothetical protein
MLISLLRKWLADYNLTPDERRIAEHFIEATDEYVRWQSEWENTDFYKQRMKRARILMIAALIVVIAGMIGLFWVGAQILVLVI